jgi:cytochrome c oxidase subunit 4
MKSDKLHPPGYYQGDEHGSHGPPDPHGADHAPHDNTKYYWVFFWLCVLTSLSFLTMHFFADTPSVGWTIMMAVSCTKALLVMCFFMHLIWEANWKYVLTIPAGMMSIFLLIMLIPDVGCRTDNYTDERWLMAPVPQEAGEHAGPFHAPGVHVPGEDKEAGKKAGHPDKPAERTPGH